MTERLPHMTRPLCCVSMPCDAPLLLIHICRHVYRFDGAGGHRWCSGLQESAETGHDSVVYAVTSQYLTP